MPWAAVPQFRYSTYAICWKYGNRFSAYWNWKATRAGDISSEYRFYGLVVLRLKVLDEANIGDGVFVSAAVVRM
jgi:hypothetical protein